MTIFTYGFTGTNGAAWPSPWTTVLGASSNPVIHTQRSAFTLLLIRSTFPYTYSTYVKCSIEYASLVLMEISR